MKVAPEGIVLLTSDGLWVTICDEIREKVIQYEVIFKDLSFFRNKMTRIS